MEIFLIIALIIVFLITMNSLSRKMDTMQQSFNELGRRLDQYKKAAEAAERPAAASQAAPVQQTPPPKAPPPVATPTAPVPERPVVPVPIQPEPPKTELPKPKIFVPDQNEPRLVIEAPRTGQQPTQQIRVPQPPQKSWWECFKEQNPDLEKFIGENLINKIGILILVLGISYFVKYAIDKNWIGEPARVGVGILAGGIVMLVAHRLRINYKAFSSVLVAGAIAIFYFTITVAFHDYHLFGQTAAFIIMVGITAFSAFISVNYNRQELAVLSLIGGFAAPFMVSTGSGNYIVLFTYIAILNIGLLSISYYKKWIVVNVVAFVFTIILYGAWLYDVPEIPGTGALAFAFMFYLIFALMNIINNIRTKSVFTNRELSILVSNTFIFYGEGMYILEETAPQYKGVFTLLLGIFNFVFAWLLYKKLAMDQKIIYILIGLTLTFVTLTIPIQFEGNYITLFWAAEAVLLIWLAQKSGMHNFRFGSAIVHALMLISLLIDWVQLYTGSDPLTPVINPAFLTGLFAIASCISVVQLLKHDTENYSIYGITFNTKNYTASLKIITLLLLYAAGFIELKYQADTLLESVYAAYSTVVLYHLIFSMVLIFLYLGKDKTYREFASLLGVVNIILFVFIFSLIAFNEVEEYLLMDITSKLGYWLHLASLAVILYTASLVYKMNRENMVSKFKAGGLLPWAAVFVLVYFASSELLLHWLLIGVDRVAPLNRAVTGGHFVIDYKNINLMRAQVVKTGYPVLWGIIAGLLLYTGIKQQLKQIRIVALVLLGLTILKLFVYDIRNASETGKIVAFILLGVLILIISFVYQKLKLLVITNKPETNFTPNENPESDTHDTTL